MTIETADNRCHYFDFLRVAAICVVMILHVASTDWYTPDLHTFEWQVINFWHGSMFRWGVPVFTMISGALFLSRDIPLRKIYGKYVLRLFVALVFWSIIYSCARYAVTRDLADAVTLFFNGGFYHLWFLPVIIGLYMIQPFMRKIAESELLTKYFLVLAIIFTFIMPEAAEVISIFSEECGTIANGLVSRFQPNFVAGLTFYFLMGYFLNNLKITPKIKRLLYALAIFGLIWGQSLSVVASFVTGSPNETFYATGGSNETFYEHISVCGLCVSMAVFIFFKEKFNRPSRIIRTLSKYTFGTYLFHAFVISVFKHLGFTPLIFNPIISVPVIFVIVFVISFSVSALLNHIPVINKYIV